MAHAPTAFVCGPLFKDFKTVGELKLVMQHVYTLTPDRSSQLLLIITCMHVRMLLVSLPWSATTISGARLLEQGLAAGVDWERDRARW